MVRQSVSGMFHLVTSSTAVFFLCFVVLPGCSLIQLGSGDVICPMVSLLLEFKNSPRTKLWLPQEGGGLVRLHSQKKKDFTKKAFLTLSWPHLGLHLEISRLDISPRKLS